MEVDVYKAVAIPAIGAVIWFIKGLISDNKKRFENLETKVATNSTNIEVLKSDHSNLDKKIDKIGEGVHEINTWIRNLKQT